MFTPGPGWALVGPRQRPENLPASAVRAVTANDRTPGAVAWLAAAAYRASQRSRRDRLRRCPWPSGTAGKSASLADAAAIAARAAGMGQVVVAVGGDGLASRCPARRPPERPVPDHPGRNRQRPRHPRDPGRARRGRARADRGAGTASRPDRRGHSGPAGDGGGRQRVRRHPLGGGRDRQPDRMGWRRSAWTAAPR